MDAALFAWNGAMAQQNVELVRQVYEATRRRDLEAFLALTTRTRSWFR